MSRAQGFDLEKYMDQYDDLLKALDLDRAGIAKLCGLGKDAPGWWRHSKRIPLVHLETLANELERRLKGKEPAPIEKRALGFVRVALASGSAVPISHDSAFYNNLGNSLPIQTESKKTRVPWDLTAIPLESLIKEVRRRGGSVSFGAKKRLFKK